MVGVASSNLVATTKESLVFPYLRLPNNFSLVVRIHGRLLIYSMRLWCLFVCDIS